MEAPLAERGQVVIPKAIRDQLGLTPGTLLTFSVDDGKLVIRKKVDDAISRVRGRFKFADGDSLEQWMRDTRGRAPGDPIEPWEELRDDIDLPTSVREDHARRRAVWLATRAQGTSNPEGLNATASETTTNATTRLIAAEPLPAAASTDVPAARKNPAKRAVRS
jgi:antitoxin PrlF